MMVPVLVSRRVLLSFADSVEAAARSLPKVTHHSVEELLDSIFQDRLEDGQLDECPLTLEEVATIKKSFLKTTLNMLHSRIEYPDEEKDSRHPFPKMPANTSSFLHPHVEVANQYASLHFDPCKINNFFEVIFSVHRHSITGELSIVFMDRISHSKLHGKYLQDYRPTDVITFPADQENGLAGEICVSVDQAIEESDRRSLSFEHELSLYLIHGGYTLSGLMIWRKWIVKSCAWKSNA